MMIHPTQLILIHQAELRDRRVRAEEYRRYRLAKRRPRRATGCP